MLSFSCRSFGRSFAAKSKRTAVAAPSVVKRLYHENIVEHYENPRNVGSLDKSDDAVGTVSNTVRDGAFFWLPF